MLFDMNDPYNMIYGDYESADLLLPELDEDIDVGLSARVILFNDEDHTFEEVISQIMRATGCSIEEAEALTVEVHERGKAMVFDGPMNACLRVSAILEEISLHTQVEF